MEWQPMDTVPKDGQEVLLAVERRAGMRGCCLVGHYMPGGHCIEDHPPIDEGWYFWNGCSFDKASKPIAWMPLPESGPNVKIIPCRGCRKDMEVERDVASVLCSKCVVEERS
jgi:hypothetical protein